MTKLMGGSESEAQALQWVGYVVTAIAPNGENWLKDTYDYYEYSWRKGQPTPASYTDKGVQNVLVATRDILTDPVYVALRKTDGNGNPLAGAVFGVCTDAAAKHQIGTIVIDYPKYGDFLTPGGRPPSRPYDSARQNIGRKARKYFGTFFFAVPSVGEEMRFTAK